MGWWETYCCVCGGPVHKARDSREYSKFLEIAQIIIKDDFKEDPKWKKTFDDLQKNIEWLDDYGAILEDGKYHAATPETYNSGCLDLHDITVIVDPNIWYKILETHRNMKKKTITKKEHH